MSNSHLIIVSTLALLAAALLVAELLLHDRRRIDHRLQQRKQQLRQRVGQSRIFKEFKSSGDASAGECAPGVRERLQLLLEQSGTGWSARRVLTISTWLAAASGMTAAFIGNHLAWALPAALLAFPLPTGYVTFKRRRRIEQLRGQLPEVFDLMCRALQAGQTLVSAFQVVARQCSPPIADEFAYCCEQQNLGLPHETSLRDLARRTGVIELQMFAVALVLQRQAGGSPIELLQNLSELVRKRTKLSLRIRAITSEGRMQAVVLSLLPGLSLFGIYVIDRSYAEILMNQPQLLAGIAASVLMGVLWIRRIVNFEY